MRNLLPSLFLIAASFGLSSCGTNPPPSKIDHIPLTSIYAPQLYGKGSFHAEGSYLPYQEKIRSFRLASAVGLNDFIYLKGSYSNVAPLGDRALNYEDALSGSLFELSLGMAMDKATEPDDWRLRVYGGLSRGNLENQEKIPIDGTEYNYRYRWRQNAMMIQADLHKDWKSGWGFTLALRSSYLIIENWEFLRRGKPGSLIGDIPDEGAFALRLTGQLDLRYGKGPLQVQAGIRSPWLLDTGLYDYIRGTRGILQFGLLYRLGFSPQ